MKLYTEQELRGLLVEYIARHPGNYIEDEWYGNVAEMCGECIEEFLDWLAKREHEADIFNKSGAKCSK